MTTTCAATGCNARPAANGLCTRHLGINPNRPTKTARPRAVFIDTLPPDDATGHKPIDVDTATELRQHPGHWARYPAEAAWHDYARLTRRQKNTRLSNVARRARNSHSAWAGWAWEATIRDGALYIRCIGPDLSTTSLKKPA